MADHLKIWDVVQASLENKPGSQSRLYFLDGTFPGKLPAGVNYDDIPGQDSKAVQQQLIPLPICAPQPVNKPIMRGEVLIDHKDSCITVM